MMWGKEENEWTNMKMWRNSQRYLKGKRKKISVFWELFYISNGLIEENSFYRSTKRTRIHRALIESWIMQRNFIARYLFLTEVR